ncbi:hypothetical protein FRC08_007148 [Ceratobasidium sp. 394]|nr:hypothetical protein FRC08_007148 [Ceratobasidium sp. 394]
MPTKERLQKAKLRAAGLLKDSWECPFCFNLFSCHKNAPKRHKRTCKKRPKDPEPAPKSPVAPPKAVQGTSESSEASTDTRNSSSEDEAQAPSHPTPKQHQNAQPEPFLSPASPPASHTSEEARLPGNMPATLEETEIWIKRHPASGIPSGYGTQQPQDTKSSQTDPSTSKLPPFFPLRTRVDYLQAEIFSRNNCSDGHINDQLRMLHQTGAYSHLPQSERLTLKDAADYHATLAKACGASDQFTSHSMTTRFKGHDYVHDVKFRPVFPVLRDIVGDPKLFKEFALHPEQPFIRRSEQDPTPMRVWEELKHGDDWWEMQDSIPADQYILHLVIYLDETNVSTIGGVEVWPVYVWVGNLPGAIRKQRKNKGGAVLVGYLPEVASKGDMPLSDTDLAELRVCVYHDALDFIFESLKVPARNGTPMRCGDGKIRIFHPTIGAISVDYKELCRIVCILGSKSGFPCPVCLVPHCEQHNLLGTWPLRTVEASRELVARAMEAKTQKQRDKILREQSLRAVDNIFYNIIPRFFSVYLAVTADPLHQIEQGIFGKHIWPWIRDGLSKKHATVLDARFKSIPRYPDLKHFPNGVTTLKNVTGTEHGVILRLLAPLLEDLLPVSCRKVTMTVLRSLAKIHMLAKFTTHTEATLEDLEQEIACFSKAYSLNLQKFAQLHESIGTDYPKLHSLSHLAGIIRRKSTTDNYHTGLGEALHPQSKKDYRRTNHQETYKDQMLRIYQERELLIRIRARIEQQNATEDQESYQLVSGSESFNRIEFGQHPVKKLTSTFAREQVASDPGAKYFVRELRTFLYQEVGGFGTAFHFRERALPHLDGTTVAIHKVLRIGYVSLLDSRDGLDVARVTDSWRNKGARKDFVLFNGKHGLAVAQLLAVFTFKMLGKTYPIAYIRPFRVLRRDKTTGYLELKDEHVRNFIFVDSIIRSCVVLSPRVRPDVHVLHDMEGPDMYLRLMNDN